MRRGALLLVIALALPLAGCLQDDEADVLRETRATYSGEAYSKEVFLHGPEDALDRDGQRRPAYVLEVDSFLGGPYDYEGLQGKDLYALDGDLRVGVKQWGCVMLAEECMAGPAADWRSQGSLPLDGFLWPLAIARGGLDFQVDGVAFHLDVEQTRDDGLDVLTVKAPTGVPWSMADEARFVYDGSPFPLRIEHRDEGDWKVSLERTALDVGDRLAPIAAWPRAVPSPSAPAAARLFPGDDRPVLGSAFPPAAMVEALLQDSAQAREQLADGCLVEFRYPHGGSGWGQLSPFGINASFEASTDAGIGILDGDGLHMWTVTEERSALLGQETGRSMAVQGEDLERVDFSCSDVTRSPGPALTAQEFIAQAAALRNEGSEDEMFWYAMRPPYSSDRPAELGWATYAVWQLPEGQRAGMLWPQQMDASTGWWDWVSVPDGGMERLAIVPASS